MQTPAFESDSRKFSKVLMDSQIKAEGFSQSLSQNRSSKSPLSKGTVSPKYYSSSISYQRASQISPTLEIQSKNFDKQELAKMPQQNYEQKLFYKPKNLDINQNSSDSQIAKNDRLIKDPVKLIANLKSRIKEEQFLIELENSVHKELISLLSKKDKSIASLKAQKLDQNFCYQIQEQTQAYLDKAESYVKEIKKLEDIANKHYS